MPASGRGANLDLTRRIGASPPPAPARPAPTPRQQAVVNLRSAPTAEPFHAAQQQAQHNVQHAQAQLPAQPTPHIPRLANPTPAQVHVALSLARHSQDMAIGANPGAQREQQYQRGIISDPRNADFVRSVAHYIQAERNRNAQLLAPDLSLGHAARPAVIHEAVQGHNILQQANNIVGPVHSNDIAELEKLRRAYSKPERQIDLANPTSFTQTLLGQPVTDGTTYQRNPSAAIQAASEAGTAKRFNASRVAAIPQELAEQKAERESRDLRIKLPGATIDPSKGVLAALNVAANLSPAPHGVIGDILNEAVDLPGQTFLSSFLTGAGTAEAAQGHPQQIESIGKGVKEQFTHPIRSLEQAPLATLLTLAGAFSGGETAAAGLARGLGPTALKDALSTARPDLKLYGEPVPSTAPRVDPGAPRVPGSTDPVRAPTLRSDPNAPQSPGIRVTNRSYNKAPTRMIAQKVGEKAMTKLPGSLRQADPFQAEGWRLRRNLAGGKFTRTGYADYTTTGEEQSRRIVQKGTVRKVVEHAPKNDTAAEAVPYIFDKTARTPQSFKADMPARQKHLEDVQPSLIPRERSENQVSIDHIKSILKDPELAKHLPEAFASAKRLRALQVPLTALRVLHGGLDANQLRAALFPYAQAHMGAKHFTVEDHLAAEKAALKRGDVQGAREVSGRDPVKLAHYEAAQADTAAAATRMDQAQSKLAFEQRESEHLKAAERAAPRNQDKAALGIRRDKLLAAQAEYRAAHDQVRQVAQATKGVKKPQPQAALRYADGRILHTQDIYAHLDAAGLEHPGFISHQGGGKKSFFASVRGQPAAEGHRRTGEAYRKGTVDHSYQGLTAHFAAEAGKVAQHEGRTFGINHYTMGSFDHVDEAHHAADNLELANHADASRIAAINPVGLMGRLQGDTRPALTVIDKGTHRILEKGFVDNRDIHGTLEQHHLTQHTDFAQPQDGKYAVIPTVVHDRWHAHDKAVSAGDGALGDVKRFAQAYTQAFRHVKFATSPKHMLGIAEENLIRPIAEGAGPTAILTGHKFMDAVSKAAEVDHTGLLADNVGPLGSDYRAINGILAGRGGIVESQGLNDITRKGNTWINGALGRGVEGAGRSLPMKGWLAYRHGTENALIAIEHQGRGALIGKALKEGGFVKSYRDILKLQDEGMRQWIDGKMTVNSAVALAKRVDDMGGNWNHQTPAVRALVSSVMTFGNWWLNSMRWLYRLPVTHPVKTAIAASLYNGTRALRNAEGQGYNATSKNKKFLQGTFPLTLPVFGSGRVNLGYYSPMGVAGPEAPRTAIDQMLPQFSGLISGLKGESSLTGEKLKQANGEELTAPQAVLNALSSVLSGPTVGAQQAESLTLHGRKPYGTSNLLTNIIDALGGPAQGRPGTEQPWPVVLGKQLVPLKFSKDASGPQGRGGAAAAGSAGTAGATISPRQAAALARAVKASNTTISPRQELALREASKR